MTQTTAVASSANRPDDLEYTQFLTQVRQCFLSTIEEGARPLFTTDADPGALWEAYLSGFPADERQIHNCSACRDFIRHHAGLVTIDERGLATPALLNPGGDGLVGPRAGLDAMGSLVRRAKVTGVFLSSAPVLGRPLTGIWPHLSVELPEQARYTGRARSAHAAMAAKSEDFRTVSRALGEFTPAMLDQALTLLETDSLYRAEKVIGPARWLRELHSARDAALDKNNVTWLHIATAPDGFCHPRASMIGTLLEDIAAGLPYEDVAARFKAKMHPLQYQRPQAPPDAGTIAQAEKLVAQLGVAGSLERRFARLDEVVALWTPRPAPPAAPSAGVFGHLTPKSKGGGVAVPPMEVPPVTVTWVKFRSTVLPTAERIEFLPRAQPDSYTALLTATNPDAPPILQWDLPERRNPVSWYFWHKGSPPEQFGLRAGVYVPVTAIILKPPMWHDEAAFGHQGQAVFLLLKGARETRTPGLCLFPEMLKSEFHGIRSVLEAHSHSRAPTGMKDGSACGIALSRNERWNHELRVTSSGRTLVYRLDRWD